MTSLYRRLRLRAGLRVGTGYTDWQFIYRTLLLVILFGYAAWTMKLDADLQATQAQAAHLEARLDMMSARIASCLREGPVGWDANKKKARSSGRCAGRRKKLKLRNLNDHPHRSQI